MEVPVTTLDALFSRHGRPDFVKIDVEGFEDAVMRGLSTPVPALSFEFQRALLAPAEASLARLNELGPYSFQFVTNTRDGSSPPRPDRPTDAGTLLSLLHDLETDAYGDVYARLTAQQGA